MKLSRHLCDFCGGTIKPKELHATLTAPNFTKVDATPPPQREDAFNFMAIHVAMFGGRPAHDSQEYDVCRGCVEGLLRAREWLREQKREFERG